MPEMTTLSPCLRSLPLLADAGVIDGTLSDPLKAMAGFRNVAVHDYRKLNL
jgi:uncharacterized protein YutE (UPF0331/DUF86 family)